MAAPASFGESIFRHESAVSPLPIDSFSAAFAQHQNRQIPQKIRMIPEAFTTDFHPKYQHVFALFFHQLFRAVSEGNRGGSGHKNGESEAEARLCGKLNLATGSPLQVVLTDAAAHNLWHVEHQRGGCTGNGAAGRALRPSSFARMARPG